jgi:DNA-binding transcriptional ArsR family regulator
MKPAAGDLHVFKAGFFRALAHPTRIRILEALVRKELSVGEMQQQLGLEQSLVSQQLSILRAKSIVVARRTGTTVRYTVGDPLLAAFLDVARQIFNNHLVGTRTLLRELQREERHRQ